MRSFKLAIICLILACGPLQLQAAQPTSGRVPAGALSADAARMAAEDARREAALLNTIKNAYAPPQAGIMPHPDDIPMSGAWEDPDWDSPLMQSIYKNPYSYGNNLDNYLSCLKEAVGGNPKAMLALSMYCYLWGYVLEEQYPDFPAEVHNADFWREWAARVTNPGWVALRLGDLHGRWPVSSLDYYRQAADLGNAEGMYNYYKITGKRLDYLYRSAALGYAKAAFLLSEELEKQGGEENVALARSYTWLAAMNADEWGLLHSSFSFYNGDFASPGGTATSSCEQGYLYAVLNMRYQYGSSFSTQNPDNICMLSGDVISRLEAAADRWQADYDQRRLPHVLRARYKSAPVIEAMQTELDAVVRKLEVTRTRAVSAGQSPNHNSGKGFALPWHLGFFSANDASSTVMSALSIYGGQHFSDQGGYTPWIYAFVVLSMVFGAVLMFYAARQKNKKKQKVKSV